MKYEGGLLRSISNFLINMILKYQWRIQDFPLGADEPLGGADLRRRSFLVETFVKTKELDPIGGGGRRQRPWTRQRI